jgi:hypothetical protein
VRKADLRMLEERFLGPHRQFFAEVDAALKGRRGAPLVSVSYLWGGIVLLMLSRRHLTITELAEYFAHDARPQELKMFSRHARGRHHRGPRFRPSLPQLYRVNAAMKRAFAEKAGLSNWRAANMRDLLQEESRLGMLNKFASMLLEGTWPALAMASGKVALDTSLVDAYSKPIKIARIRAGERASDPDARHRKLERPGAKPKHYFGYGIQTVSTSGFGHEYIMAVAVNSANADDRPVVVNLVRRLLGDGQPIAQVMMDRGFSNSRPTLERFRAMGCDPIFDLKSNQDRRSADWKGCLILDGSPYLPTLPKRLYLLERPGLRAGGSEKQAREEKIDEKAWQEKIDERQLYALVANGKGTPTSVRVQSPLFRNRRFGCPHVPGSMRRRDLALPVCDGNHAPDEACALANATWRSKDAPWTFQRPVWGTREWRNQYKRRSAIERSFNLLKNADVVGLRPGEFRLRGLANMTMLVALGFVAVNLHLGALDQAGAAHSPPEATARAA